jgi:hypothetical protein
VSYRPLALVAAVAAWSSMHVAIVAAQPAYVAPGGVAIGAGAGPVFVTPGVPINRAAAHVGPVADYDLPYEYGYRRGPAPSYEYGPGRRYSYGYGPRRQYDRPPPRSEPPPRSDYGYGPPPRHSYGDGPGPRYDYGYGAGPRDYGHGPPPPLQTPRSNVSPYAKG